MERFPAAWPQAGPCWPDGWSVADSVSWPQAAPGARQPGFGIRGCATSSADFSTLRPGNDFQRFQRQGTVSLFAITLARKVSKSMSIVMLTRAFVATLVLTTVVCGSGLALHRMVEGPAQEKGTDPNKTKVEAKLERTETDCLNDMRGSSTRRNGKFERTNLRQGRVSQNFSMELPVAS